MSENPLTVFQIEPHSWWRDIVATSLSRWPEYRLLGAATTGLEGIEQALALRPQVVVFDWQLPDLDGRDLAATLLTIAPAPQLVLLTDQHETIEPALVTEFGVAAVVSKNTRVSEHLPAALAEIRAGRMYLPPALLALVGRPVRTAPGVPVPAAYS